MVFEFISNLESFGFYDFVLPFLLIFTIIFAILEKTRIFGTEDNKPRRNINFVLALVIALIVIVQTDLVYLMNAFLSKMALFILIVVIFFLTVGIFGVNSEEGFSGWPLGVGIIITIIMIIWALNPDLTSLGFPSWFIPTDKDKTILLTLGIFLIVLFILFGRTGGGDKRYGTAEFLRDLNPRRRQ